ncbi:molybdopterin cofactor-binding domain-containing protein [Halomonas sp. PA16-9]|uniref:molybdopterin cofactor-binding domain-containing protein n=1 Tax=Halomonas sp. PA16-9 TaxID=2576841 RepID=UPI0018C81E57
MPAKVFSDIARTDARGKVLGQTPFGADMIFPDILHAMLVPATIAKGTVSHIDITPAAEISGVVQILSLGDFPTLSPQINYLGQPIAMVIAETLEAAIEGAEAVTATYEAASFVPLMDSPNASVVSSEGFETGDVDTEFRHAVEIVEGTFETPVQHHNAMELFGTVARWSGGRLTIYEGCQNSASARNALAEALGISSEAITIRSDYVGGGFGQKSPPKLQTALVAEAARLTRRPVKLVTPRGQLFHIATFRPRSIHHIRLAANSEGRLTALNYDVVQENWPDGGFRSSGYHEDIARLYAIENLRATAGDVHIDRNMPRHTRGTHPFSAGFALESAIDEMAYRLGVDPVQLRLDHEATTDIIAGQPLAPHFLNDCLREGARRFDWSRRTPKPGSMRLEDGTLVGFGVACGIFGASGSAAETTLRVRADGTTRITSSGHEMGQGIRTAVANTILQGLDVNPDRIEILMGDTSVGPQMATVGERGTASITPATIKAVEALRVRFEKLLAGSPPRRVICTSSCRV